MTQEIIDYYNTELKFKTIVSRYKPLWRRLLLGFFLIYLFSSLFILANITFFSSHEWYILAWLIGFVPIGIAIQYLNARAIKKIFPKMSISVFEWSAIKYRRMVKAKLKKKLLKLEIRNKDQVKQVSDLVKIKAQNERIPYIISATTFGILFTPIWYSFIDKTFDLYKDQFQYLLAFFAGGTFLVVVISIIAPMIVDIRDNMLTKYNDLNALSEYLDDIHMEL